MLERAIFHYKESPGARPGKLPECNDNGRVRLCAMLRLRR
jgi:hypothetical protein